MALLRYSILITLYSCFSIVVAQEKTKVEFGVPTYAELKMKTYSKDPDASGVVLYEKGENFFVMLDNSLVMVKDVHRKIKVLDYKNFDYATVEIVHFDTNLEREKINYIKAITHNGTQKRIVSMDQIYQTRETGNSISTKFTFPDVRDGSILEYSYRIISPFFWQFDGWEFQGMLPKIYSEFESWIPGNLTYSRSLYGSLKLDIDTVRVEPNCINFRWSAQPAACEVAIYALKDVPAIKVEKFMLSPQNYASRVEFELQKTTNFRGKSSYYTKTWFNIEHELKKVLDLDNQEENVYFFDEKLPPEILKITNDLERAKAVFYFIQNHFTWNTTHNIFSTPRLKKAYDENSGNTTEINLALLNALTAANLDAKIFLSSIRDRKIPNQLYPVLTDFNYFMAYLKLADVEYLLDATDKHVTFGAVPIRALNETGRVMDFKRGSYWHTIAPFSKNIYYVNAALSASEDGGFFGNVNEIFTGYIAANEREAIDELSEDIYIRKKTTSTANVEIENFKIENNVSKEESLKTTYNLRLDVEDIGNKTYLYPFFMEPYISENPFKLDDRKYPIDLGYPYSNTYVVTIDLKNTYQLLEIPKSRVYKLSEETDAGECSVVYSEANGKIQLRLSLKLNDFRFSPESYKALKEFFSHVVEIQSKEPIVLKRL